MRTQSVVTATRTVSDSSAPSQTVSNRVCVPPSPAHPHPGHTSLSVSLVLPYTTASIALNPVFLPLRPPTGSSDCDSAPRPVTTFSQPLTSSFVSAFPMDLDFRVSSLLDPARPRTMYTAGPVRHTVTHTTPRSPPPHHGHRCVLDAMFLKYMRSHSFNWPGVYLFLSRLVGSQKTSTVPKYMESHSFGTS